MHIICSPDNTGGTVYVFPGSLYDTLDSLCDCLDSLCDSLNDSCYAYSTRETAHQLPQRSFFLKSRTSALAEELMRQADRPGNMMKFSSERPDMTISNQLYSKSEKLAGSELFARIASNYQTYTVHILQIQITY